MMDETSASLDTAIAGVVEKGLAGYLAGADTADLVTDWLAEETGVRKILLRPAVRIVATLAAGPVRSGRTWLGKVARQHLKQTLSHLPGYDKLAGALSRMIQRFDTDIAARREFKNILAGRRPAHSEAFGDRLSLDLRAELRHLQDKEDLEAEIVAGFDHLTSLLNPQPPLYLNLVEPTQEARFLYGAQWAPFVGREAEIDALEAFLDREEPFRWWLLVGPGGQGKSRLALEFCIAHAMAWRAGFLPNDMSFNWHTWQPERPTLIIADYASGRAKALRQLVLALHNRRAELEMPVRLLLIEREADAPWYRSFEGSGGDRYAVTQCRHGDALVLQPLHDDQLGDLMASVTNRAAAGTEYDAKLLAELRAIDPDARPLFAALVADAMAAGRAPSQLDRTSLVRDVLEREEEKYWRPAGVTEEDKTLLALATLTGGVPVKALPIAEAGDLLPEVRSYVPARFAAMTGRPATEAVPPLEPDLLGELFVLEWLKPEHRADRRCDVLRHLAWRHAPWAMFNFLSRTVQDYIDHETLKVLRAPEDGTTNARIFWSRAAFNLIFYYGTAGEVAAAQGLYDELADLVAAAQGLYDELADLARRHPDEPGLREPQARGAVNLITYFGTAGDLEAARTRYGELATLAQSHPDEAAVREQQAMGVVNLINAYGTAGDLEAARTLYGELATLAHSHPDEAAVREWQARGAFNLIKAYMKAGDVAALARLQEEIARDEALLDTAIDVLRRAGASEENISRTLGLGR